jgi:hypothetical protein
MSDDPPAAAKPRIAASSAGQIEPNAITPSAICGVRPKIAIAAGRAAPFSARKGCGDSLHCERVQVLARRLAEVRQGVDARAFLDGGRADRGPSDSARKRGVYDEYGAAPRSILPPSNRFRAAHKVTRLNEFSISSALSGWKSAIAASLLVPICPSRSPPTS